MKSHIPFWGAAACIAICFLCVLGISQTLSQPPTSEPMRHPRTMTNLDQCKMAMKGLKMLGGFKFKQSWLVEQHGRTNGLPVVLTENGKTVQYSAVLISVDCLDINNTNLVSEIQMQAPNMNIDETRKLGLQLCAMLQVAPDSFLVGVTKLGIVGWINRYLELEMAIIIIIIVSDFFTLLIKINLGLSIL